MVALVLSDLVLEIGGLIQSQHAHDDVGRSKVEPQQEKQRRSESFHDALIVTARS